MLKNLKIEYEKDSLLRKNGTLLLGLGNMPKSRHILFHPLSNKYIYKFLVSEYSYTIPKDYIKILEFTNGANLFTIKIEEDGFSFAHSMLVIYGLPLTPPWDRPFDMEEPFDIRIEDLARHINTPNSWLKCGTYTKTDNYNITIDVFIDTLSNKVYTCEKNSNIILACWDNIDECLCEIFNDLKHSTRDGMHRDGSVS